MQRMQNDPCKQYKRREIAGFVLLPVGIGAIAGGAVMINKGIIDIENHVNTINAGEPSTAYVPRHDIVLVTAGAALGVIGLALAPTGLAMGISGAVRYRKYCGRARSFYISPDTQQGLGVACTF